MKRFLMALMLVAVTATYAEAGRRCWRSSGHTLYNSHTWGQNCWSCHPKQKTYSNDWRTALATVANRQQDNLSFEASLAQILNVQQQTQPQQQFGYPQGYSTTYQGMYSSSPYPLSGNTQFGASAYVQPQQPNWANLATMYQTHGKLTEQTLNGGIQLGAQHGSLVAQEAAIQADVRKFEIYAQNLRDVAFGPPQPGKQETLQYEVTTTPQGQPVVHQMAPANVQAMEALKPVVTAKCISCHSGESPSGKLNMAAGVTKDQLKLMNEAVDAGTMPKNPDGSPAEKLSLEERALFSNAWLTAP